MSSLCKPSGLPLACKRTALRAVAGRLAPVVLTSRVCCAAQLEDPLEAYTKSFMRCSLEAGAHCDDTLHVQASGCQSGSSNYAIASY